MLTNGDQYNLATAETVVKSGIRIRLCPVNCKLTKTQNLPWEIREYLSGVRGDREIIVNTIMNLGDTTCMYLDR